MPGSIFLRSLVFVVIETVTPFDDALVMDDLPSGTSFNERVKYRQIILSPEEVDRLLLPYLRLAGD